MKKHSTMLSSLMVVLVLILTGCRGLPERKRKQVYQS